MYFESNDLYNAGNNYLKAESLLSKTTYLEGEYEVFNNFANYFEKIGDPLYCYFAAQISYEVLKNLGLNNLSEINRIEQNLTRLRELLDQMGFESFL